jgi:hypothetical protein
LQVDPLRTATNAIGAEIVAVMNGNKRKHSPKPQLA